MSTCPDAALLRSGVAPAAAVQRCGAIHLESGGTMRLPMHLKTISIALAVLVVSFVASLKVMDFVAPRATNRPPVLARIAAAAAGAARVHRDGADCGCAVGDPRRRRSRRAALLRRQGRQSDIADPAERRYRLDRLARADQRDRRAGRAVAGDAADGHIATSPARCRRRRRARSATRSAACSAATSPSRSAA